MKTKKNIEIILKSLKIKNTSIIFTYPNVDSEVYYFRKHKKICKKKKKNCEFLNRWVICYIYHS